MSRNQFVDNGDRGFWAFNDALQGWLAYLVEEADRTGLASEPWLDPIVTGWRVCAVVNDLGARIPDLPEPERLVVLRIAGAARRRALERGDLPIGILQSWTFLDGHPVAGGFSRTGAVVEVARVIEVADAFIAVMDGSFPPDPPCGAWHLGTGGPDSPTIQPMTGDWRTSRRVDPK